MLDAVAWWVAVQLVGGAALPLALRLFPRLPDRGYAMARPLGLLLVGYLLWQGAMLGLLTNGRGTVLVLVAAVGAACWLLLRREVALAGELWRRRRWLILGTEGLFLGAFALWALVRAHNPEISATEKPMEIMFLNGVLRSERFPPVDPWLAGHSISYYYFGYVIVALVTMLSGVAATIAFNLALATLFALTATGVFSVGGNLAAGATDDEDAELAAAQGADPPVTGDQLAVRKASPRTRRLYVVGGAIAIALTLLLSNLEPLIEFANARGSLSPTARAWVNIKDLPSAGRGNFMPDDNWWWFRATRVIGDPASQGDYTITEFPFFSFLLGDMHPHVLALPFAILSLAFSLNLARGSATLTDLRRRPLGLATIGLIFGGLSFLNAWDMLTYLFVLVGAFALQRAMAVGELSRPVWRDTLLFGLIALGVSVLGYLDFYAYFSSQTSGIGSAFPLFNTATHHFFFFWGPFYFVAISFLGYALVATWRGAAATAPRDWTRQGVVWFGAALVAAVLALLSLPAVGFAGLAILMAVAAGVRVFTPGPPIVVEQPVAPPKRTRARRPRAPVEIAGGAIPGAWVREHLFALYLIGTAMLLIVGCEFVFIRDSFGNRMNTVFKLYYQAWLLLAVGGAYGLVWLGRRWLAVGGPTIGKAAWSLLAAIFAAVSLLYVVGATLNKTQSFRGPATLDGMAYFERFRPDDLALIRWLNSNVAGTPTTLEMWGGSYQGDTGRIASFTGLPTLLGWDFHERQWRGTSDEANRRKPDIEKIYKSTNANEVRSLLDKYGITYVVVGQTERDKFGREPGALEKFPTIMDVAYRAPGGATIYRVRGR